MTPRLLQFVLVAIGFAALAAIGCDSGASRQADADAPLVRGELIDTGSASEADAKAVAQNAGSAEPTDAEKSQRSTAPAVDEDGEGGSSTPNPYADTMTLEEVVEEYGPDSPRTTTQPSANASAEPQPTQPLDELWDDNAAANDDNADPVPGSLAAVTMDAVRSTGTASDVTDDAAAEAETQRKAARPNIFVPSSAAIADDILDDTNDAAADGPTRVSFKQLGGYDLLTGKSQALPVVRPGEHAPQVDPNAASNRPITDEEQIIIPDALKKLDGKEVRIRGFMVPVEFRDGGTKRFLLLGAILSCYYCQVPQPNQWVDVEPADGKRVDYTADDPIDVYGTLEVSPQYEEGFLTSVYRMKSTRVVHLGER